MFAKSLQSGVNKLNNLDRLDKRIEFVGILHRVTCFVHSAHILSRIVNPRLRCD